jgi:hypothetical protein
MPKIKLVHLKPFIYDGVEYQPVVIRGKYFSGKKRTLSNVRKVAEKMGLLNPPGMVLENPTNRMGGNKENPFVSFLRRNYPPEEIGRMGFAWWIVMHPPYDFYWWFNMVAQRQVVLGKNAEYAYELEMEDVMATPRRASEERSWWANDGFVFLAREAKTPQK